MTVNIKRFSKSDKEAVFTLLSTAALPTEDLTAEKLQHFLVAKERDGSVAGLIGIEIMQDTGLLRSLVVDPGYRHSGLGQQLTHELELHAKKIHINTLYLLTTTAAEFFQKLDYQVMPRQDVPAAIAGTDEFKSICPSSSICLFKELIPADRCVQKGS